MSAVLDAYVRPALEVFDLFFSRRSLQMKFVHNHGAYTCLPIWLVGLALGIFLSCRYGRFFIPLMRSAVYEPVSIVGLIVSQIFPLIITLLSVFCGRFDFLFFLCFLKAFSYGFSAALVNGFGISRAWLIRFLFLFSDHICLPVFLWLWICGYAVSADHRKFAYVGCTAVVVTVICLDYLIISPLLQGLF